MKLAEPTDTRKPWLTIAILATAVFLLLVAKSPAAPFPDGRYAYGPPPADGRAACDCANGGKCECGPNGCPCEQKVSAAAYVTDAEAARLDAIYLKSPAPVPLVVFVGQPKCDAYVTGYAVKSLTFATGKTLNESKPGVVIYRADDSYDATTFKPLGRQWFVGAVLDGVATVQQVNALIAPRAAVSTGTLSSPVLPPAHFAPLPGGAPTFGGCAGGQCGTMQFAPQFFGQPAMMGGGCFGGSCGAGGCANGRCGR